MWLSIINPARGINVGSRKFLVREGITRDGKREKGRPSSEKKFEATLRDLNTGGPSWFLFRDANIADVAIIDARCVQVRFALTLPSLIESRAAFGR